jgi:4-aminobutyrate aminotransferase/(S)-3-amino-2-methylpropionate transaminase
MAKSSVVKITGEIPGPKSQELFRMIDQSVPRGILHSTPIAISSASGATITDVDGNTYIDFTGGIGVLNVGHRAEEVITAIKEQVDKYLHACFHVVTYEPYMRLAAKLNELAPGKFPKKTMLVNSGAEAVENAIKIARYYTKRYGVLSFMGGFHGRTALDITLTGQTQPFKQSFGPLVPGVYHLPYAYCYRCPFGNEYPRCELLCVKYIEQFFATVIPSDDVAALIAEPVQGEGGFIVPPKEFFTVIDRICKERGILLIADEIQTGFGRTGKMFASEHFQIEPDMMTIGKSLGGGTVLAAVTGRSDVMDAPHVGGIGGTYGGNPISCQASLAVIDLIQKKDLLHRAVSIGDRLKQRFCAMQEKYPIIGDVRGIGAMVGMELVRDRVTKEPAAKEAALVRQKSYKNGLILVGAGVYHNVIRVLAPLVITDEELDEGLSILEEAIKSL